MNILRKLKRYIIYSFKTKINIDNPLSKENFNFDQLFRQYNCDKASSYVSSDKKFLRGHDYGPFYEKHFYKMKHKKINILELGVYSGASSASFANYFPASTIYCLDFNLTTFKYSSKKFKVFGLDISNKIEVEDFFNKNNIEYDAEFFDIIIDDCSHKLSDQINFLFSFFKNLKRNGIYVIEEFRFPNLYSHLNDCENEYKIDEMLDFIKNKKIFKSSLVKKDQISELFKKVKKINTHKGYREDSDIAFIEKR